MYSGFVMFTEVCSIRGEPLHAGMVSDIKVVAFGRLARRRDNGRSRRRLLLLPCGGVALSMHVGHESTIHACHLQITMPPTIGGGQ